MTLRPTSNWLISKIIQSDLIEVGANKLLSRQQQQQRSNFSGYVCHRKTAVFAWEVDADKKSKPSSDIPGSYGALYDSLMYGSCLQKVHDI